MKDKTRRPSKKNSRKDNKKYPYKKGGRNRVKLGVLSDFEGF